MNQSIQTTSIDRDPEAIARRIAERLFTNGAGEKAERLVLTIDGRFGLQSRDLGGWSFESVVREIVTEMERE